MDSPGPSYATFLSSSHIPDLCGNITPLASTAVAHHAYGPYSSENVGKFLLTKIK
jgi:hypothetical protein